MTRLKSSAYIGSGIRISIGITFDLLVLDVLVFDRSCCISLTTRGWPRKQMNSVAEVELLSQLAVLLKPEVPIGELFRSFPAPDGWGRHLLEPDLALYGMLKVKGAALFVEYDGYWRHAEKEGIENDRMKNEALLKYSPAGSQVIRLSHTLPSKQAGNVIWIKIGTWQQGDKKSLSRMLVDLLLQAISSLGGLLDEGLAKRLTSLTNSDVVSLSNLAETFSTTADLVGAGNTTDEILDFLVSEGFDQKLVQLMQRRAPLHGVSIERSLQPKLQWQLDLGLTKKQVAKVIARLPQFLGYSIEQNLEPKARWVLDLGLTKKQVAKVIARLPQFLGYSIEQNLEPKVRWVLDLGLTKKQVAKVIARLPQFLGYSIEQNLDPKVQWLLDLGLDTSKVAKIAALLPQVFSYSIEQNLEPKVRWLLDLGLDKSRVAKIAALLPQVFCCSIEQNLKPKVRWLLDLGLDKKRVAKIAALLPQVFSYSIEQNLEPKVRWLLDLGLDKSRVAKIAALLPQVFCYSIEHNLQPKVRFLQTVLIKGECADLIVKFPQVLSYSYGRLTKRVTYLRKTDQISKIAHVMTLTEDKYLQRFGSELEELD